MSRTEPSSRRGFSAVPFLGDLLALSRLVRDKDAGLGLKALAILTFAYVLSPIDAFPEAVMPFIAWVDDVGLVLALRLVLDKQLARYRYPLLSAAPSASAAAVVTSAPSASATGVR
jgi:uncharacterized membrane protein YkvA (DUF1232 family)